MEHYCRIKKKRVQYYFDPECKRRDYLYEYQTTGWMPIYIRIIQGRIGKRFVVKHYHGRRLKTGKYRKPKIIMTRVPDMSKIVASADQRGCRNLFKEAVAFAKMVIADAPLKDTWKKRYRIPAGRVYYRAVKMYMLYLQQGTQIEPELTPQYWSVNKPVKENKAEMEVVESPENNDEAMELIYLGYLSGLSQVEKRRALRLAG